MTTCENCGTNTNIITIEHCGPECFACYADTVAHGGCYCSPASCLDGALQGWHELGGAEPSADDLSRARRAIAHPMYAASWCGRCEWETCERCEPSPA